MDKVNHDLDCARVHAIQLMLFPALPRDVCKSLGLNWWTAIKLHADGWLSFNPESTPSLDERQEVELRFIGNLVAAGCSEAMLHSLVDGLEKPFCYRPDCVFYSWAHRQWQLLPKPLDKVEEVFETWMNALEEARDLAALEEIEERAAIAIKRVNAS